MKSIRWEWSNTPTYNYLILKGYDLVEQRYVACKIHQLSMEWKEDKKANYIK